MLPLPSRVKAVSPIFLALFSLFILYVTFHFLHEPPLGNRSSRVLSASALAHEHDLAVLEFEEAFSQPLGVSDFALKGHRASLLASIARIQAESTRIDRDRLKALLTAEFPWWPRPELPPYRTAKTKKKTSSAGIVICVGSKNFLLGAHLIRTLRNVLKSTLPIQIAFAGDEDLPFNQQEALRGLVADVETLNLLDHFDDTITGLTAGGYAQKPFAAVASRFDKVLLVDADVVFLQDPAAVLHAAGFKNTGTLFYHDRAYTMTGASRLDWVRAKMNKSTPSWNVTRSLFFDEDLWQEMESGVVAFDKSKPEVFMSLLFSAWMNTKEVRKHETYAHVLGDKETYWLAAELSSTPYYFQADYAGVIGIPESKTARGETRSAKICSSHIAHMDSSGEKPLWLNGGLRLNKALKDNKSLASLTHFMTAGNTMPEQPVWRYDNDDVWCASGREAFSINDRGLDDVVQESLRQAEMLDKELAHLVADSEQRTT